LREWDRLPLAERDLRLVEYERELLRCPDCGNPISECSDPERAWGLFRRICYATMALDDGRAAYHRLHKGAEYHDGSFMKWSPVQSKEFPFHMDSGVTIGVASTDLAPWDEFTTERDASPVPPSEEPAAEDDRGDDD
jgi:hypothetical protein